MDLVFEIGCEELPAGSLKPAVEWMARRSTRSSMSGPTPRARCRATRTAALTKLAEGASGRWKPDA